MKDSNEILRQALSVARTEPRKALELLEAGLTNAKDVADDLAAAVLAKHAAVICAENGELREALSYYEEALRGNPDDAHIPLAVGHVHQQLGEYDDARVAFQRARQTASAHNDEELSRVASTAEARLDKDINGR